MGRWNHPSPRCTGLFAFLHIWGPYIRPPAGNAYTARVHLPFRSFQPAGPSVPFFYFAYKCTAKTARPGSPGYAAGQRWDHLVANRHARQGASSYSSEMSPLLGSAPDMAPWSRRKPSAGDAFEFLFSIYSHPVSSDRGRDRKFGDVALQPTRKCAVRHRPDYPMTRSAAHAGTQASGDTPLCGLLFPSIFRQVTTL